VGTPEELGYGQDTDTCSLGIPRVRTWAGRGYEQCGDARRGGTDSAGIQAVWRYQKSGDWQDGDSNRVGIWAGRGCKQSGDTKRVSTVYGQGGDKRRWDTRRVGIPEEWVYVQGRDTSSVAIPEEWVYGEGRDMSSVGIPEVGICAGQGFEQCGNIRIVAIWAGWG
jgi:hypothetical protein